MIYGGEFQRSDQVANRRVLFVAMPSASAPPSVGLCKANETAFTDITAGCDIDEIGTTDIFVVALAAAHLDTAGKALLQFVAAGASNVEVLIDVNDVMDELHLVKARLANKTEKTVATGVLETMDDDGETALLTQTPSLAAGVLTVTPS